MSKKAQKEKDFMAFYSPVHDQFERFCKARAYGKVDFEDLMHDTILIAFEKFDKVQNNQVFLHYLIGISIRVLANANRKKEEVEMNEFKNHPIQLDTKDEIEFLHFGLAQLPEEQREALILFEISGFSIKEICELTNSGESAVKQRLRRGRMDLQTILTTELKKNEKIEI